MGSLRTCLKWPNRDTESRSRSGFIHARVVVSRQARAFGEARWRLTVARGGVLGLVAALGAACATTPPRFVLMPRDDALARRVTGLAQKAGGRWGIAALHLESGSRLFWNADESFEAASVIKLALLVEGIARISEGTLDPAARWTLTDERKAAPSSVLNDFDAGLAPTERDLLMLMIARSDNTAANHFIDLFGADAVNRRMEGLDLPAIRLLGRIPDYDPEETQPARWRGLKLGAATPRTTAELYRRIVTRTLLGVASDDLLWRVLSQQRQRDRIPRLADAGIGSTWAGKTGTLSGVRADSGVLTTKAGRFVLVMLVDRIPDMPSVSVKVNETMGEIAKVIVDEWSRLHVQIPWLVSQEQTWRESTARMFRPVGINMDGSPVRQRLP
jgi:beta-lactamase class A